MESKNLDTFFTGEARTRELLADFQEGKDLVVREGVMGLYDGLGGIREEGSSYHLAKVTDTPIILVVNAHGMGKSILATIRGFLDYDTAHLIKGVLLNQTSKQFYEVIKPEIEAECKVPVVGFLPRQKEVTLESRHLGLVMPEEIADIKQQLGRVADALRDCVDIEKLLAIAATAGTLEAGKKRNIPRLADGCRIGVARDAAFCFYYEDNLAPARAGGSRTRLFFAAVRQQTPGTYFRSFTRRRIPGTLCKTVKRKPFDAAVGCGQYRKENSGAGRVWRIFVSA